MAIVLRDEEVVGSNPATPTKFCSWRVSDRFSPPEDSEFPTRRVSRKIRFEFTALDDESRAFFVSGARYAD